MDSLPPIDVQFVATAVGVAALLAGLFLLWRWHRRRRLRAARALAITNCGYEHLRDVLVPDGQGSTLHVDFLLLTARGLVVIDLRDVEGNIFGGDQMTEWTVMRRALRYTFPNPQTGLYDRIAAVRALAPELPIEGRAVFTRSGRFPKLQRIIEVTRPRFWPLITSVLNRIDDTQLRDLPGFEEQLEPVRNQDGT